MNFLKLTYYKSQKNYGPATKAKTNKKFYLNADKIVRITEYEESVKLSLDGGQDIEVCESIREVLDQFPAQTKGIHNSL